MRHSPFYLPVSFFTLVSLSLLFLQREKNSYLYNAEKTHILLAMHFQKADPKSIPLSLLLEADPSEKAILGYLEGSHSFVAIESEFVVGALIAQPLSNKSFEILNVAVDPLRQGQGIGGELMKFAIAELNALGANQIELRTGTFGYQLAFYQRLGFRVDSVVKNHFLDNYAAPIFENGIQHKDQLRLILPINESSV